MKPQEINLLSYEYIIENGTCFDGDIICWFGKYGYQVYNNPIEKNGKPFNGLLYEQYKNGQIAYYSFYKNGIEQGISIHFLSGAIKSYCIKDRSGIVGKYYEWYENGNIKKETDHYKNNHHYKFIEYDENGDVTRKGEI